MTKKCIFLQKDLVNSKKSSNFARFFVGTVLYHPSGCEPTKRSQTEKRRVVYTQARLYSSVGRALDL